jgi:hypothetical protein
MKRKILLWSVLVCFVAATVAFAQTRLRSRGAEVVIDSSSNINLKALPGQEVRLGERSSLTYVSTNYSGTSSFQPVGIDLNLAAAAGSTDGKFLSPVMGNIFGTNLTKAGNYIGGLIGHYNISGTNATTYPSGAVLGGIGDGTTTAKGAFVAYIDGDSAQTNANAAFKVMHNNSTAASKFTYGVDLYDAARDGFNAVSYANADIRLTSQVCILVAAGAPVNGTTGDNFAGPGSLYVDTTAGKLYIQTAVITNPTWVVVGSQS